MPSLTICFFQFCYICQVLVFRKHYAQESQHYCYPHCVFFPAIFLALLLICFNIFGNGLRDAFNPSLRGADE